METRTKRDMLIKMEEMNSTNVTDESKSRRDLAKTFLNTAVEIGNKVFCFIPVELLKIDHTMYQRPLQSNFKYLVNNWDDAKCDAITVNYRQDGYYYIINGQHRTEAARARGITQLVCNVFVGLSLIEEANMFVGQYDGTCKLHPHDTYRANVLRGELIDTTITRCCDKYGIQISREKAPKVLNSLTVARRIIKPTKTPTRGRTDSVESNAKILDWIFSILNVWEDYSDALNSDMMQSLWYIWTNYQNNLNYAHNKLVNFFKTSSPKEIKALGNVEYPDCGHGSGIYRIMMDIINEDTGKLAKLV